MRRARAGTKYDPYVSVVCGDTRRRAETRETRQGPPSERRAPALLARWAQLGGPGGAPPSGAPTEAQTDLAINSIIVCALKNEIRELSTSTCVDWGQRPAEPYRILKVETVTWETVRVR